MVPKLKQGRSHGESKGANAACGFLLDARFVPCGLPLLQLRDFALYKSLIIRLLCTSRWCFPPVIFKVHVALHLCLFSGVCPLKATKYSRLYTKDFRTRLWKGRHTYAEIMHLRVLDVHSISMTMFKNKSIPTGSKFFFTQPFSQLTQNDHSKPFSNRKIWKKTKNCIKTSDEPCLSTIPQATKAFLMHSSVTFSNQKLEFLESSENPGHFWPLLATFGHFWSLLAIFGNFWSLLATSATFLAYKYIGKTL